MHQLMIYYNHQKNMETIMKTFIFQNMETDERLAVKSADIATAYFYARELIGECMFVTCF